MRGRIKKEEPKDKGRGAEGERGEGEGANGVNGRRGVGV